MLTLGALQAALACGALLFASSAAAPAPLWLPVVTSVIYVGSSAFLVQGAPSDSRALYLAAFFIALGSAAAHPSLGLMGSAAKPVSALLPEAFLPFFLWRFVVRFPRVVHLGRWVRWMEAGERLSFAAGVVLFTANAALAWRPDLVPLLSRLARSAPGGIHWPVLMALCLAALLVFVPRSRDALPSERERVRFLVTGVVAGLLPGFVLVLLESWAPAVDRFTDEPAIRFYSDFLVYLPLLTIPFWSAHAVLAHRVLEFRLVAWRALSRAAYSRATATLALLAGALVAWRLYVTRTRSLEHALLTPPTPVFIGLFASGLLLRAVGPFLVRALEARSRANVDGRTVIAEFTQAAMTARSRGEVLQALTECARRGLDADNATVLVRDADGCDLVPVGGNGRPLEPRSAILALAAAEAEPLTIDPTDRDSLLRWLPAADQEWLLDGNVGLLAALPAREGFIPGLVALSQRPDEAPYSRAEALLGAALASAASLALHTFETVPFAATANRDEPGSQCPTCGRVERLAKAICSCGAATEPCVIPSELNGRFRVERVLGRGGMGVVYLGKDLQLERPVALKTLPRVRPEALIRLRREARAMAQFVHPNLALIFGTESWRGVPILVVEYLAGGTLAARLGRPADVAFVARLGMQLATALEEMHTRNLLHRDVKPSNIGFTPDGAAKLLDFGLARLADEIGPGECAGAATLLAADSSLTGAHHVVGTPLYLSPEALAGEPPSAAQDLWSLYVVLWEALAGQHPFGGRAWTPASGRGMARLETLRPDCPEAFRLLLTAALDSTGTQAEIRGRGQGSPRQRSIPLACDQQARSESCVAAFTQPGPWALRSHGG